LFWQGENFSLAKQLIMPKVTFRFTRGNRPGELPQNAVQPQ
jgi:hypothetical protein